MIHWVGQHSDHKQGHSNYQSNPGIPVDPKSVRNQSSFNKKTRHPSRAVQVFHHKQKISTKQLLCCLDPRFANATVDDRASFFRMKRLPEQAYKPWKDELFIVWQLNKLPKQAKLSSHWFHAPSGTNTGKFNH